MTQRKPATKKEYNLHPNATALVETLQGWGSVFVKDDDPQFWRIALSTVLGQAEDELSQYEGGKTTYLEIGVCSHWLRPHQSRWIPPRAKSQRGAFAWPAGYGGLGYSRTGLPQFDGSVRMQWMTDSRHWKMIPYEAPKAKRRLECRIALPARTLRHVQAAVHTIWTPGSPSDPAMPIVKLYGFRKDELGWHLTIQGSYPGKHWR